MSQKINSIEELVGFIGKPVWLVIEFHCGNVGNTSMCEWVVGKIINQQLQEYSSDLEGPWFCFEQNKVKTIQNKVKTIDDQPNYYIFEVENYLSDFHHIFTSRDAAESFRLKAKLSRMNLPIAKNMDMNIFEGIVSSMFEFKNMLSKN